MRYLHDQATLAQHWSQFQAEDVDRILNPTPPGEPEHRRARAYQRWIASYGLGDSGPSAEASQDFMTALTKGRVPKWVLAIAPFEEMKQKAGEK